MGGGGGGNAATSSIPELSPDIPLLDESSAANRNKQKKIENVGLYIFSFFLHILVQQITHTDRQRLQCS